MFRCICLICLINIGSGQLTVLSFNGDDYFASPYGLTFDEAVKYCSSNQAVLANLESPQVRNWVKTAFIDNLWIGLNSSDGRGGTFKWLDGTSHHDVDWYGNDDCPTSPCCGVLILTDKYSNKWYKRDCAKGQNALCQVSKATLLRQALDMVINVAHRSDRLVERFNGYLDDARTLYENIVVLSQVNDTLLTALGRINTEFEDELRSFKNDTDTFVSDLNAKVSEWTNNSNQFNNVTITSLQQYLNQTEFLVQHQSRFEQIASEVNYSLDLHKIVHGELNATNSRVYSLKQRFEAYLNESQLLRETILIESAKAGASGLLEIINEIQTAFKSRVYEYEQETIESIKTAHIKNQSVNLNASVIGRSMNQIQDFIDELLKTDFIINHELVHLQIEAELRYSIELQKLAYENFNVLNGRVDTLKAHFLNFTIKLVLFRQILGKDLSDNRTNIIITALDEIANDVNHTVLQFEENKSVFIASAIDKANYTINGQSLSANSTLDRIKMFNDLVINSSFMNDQETRVNLFQSELKSELFFDRLLFVKVTSLTAGRDKPLNGNELNHVNYTSLTADVILEKLRGIIMSLKLPDSSLPANELLKQIISNIRILICILTLLLLTTLGKLFYTYATSKYSVENPVDLQMTSLLTDDKNSEL